jgi:signal transduction histidine kinase
VRRRLVLAIAGVAAAAVALFALPLGVALRESYRDDELLRLQRDTFAAARHIDLGATPGDPIELPRTGDTLAVYDRAGRRVAGSGPSRADTFVRQTFASGKPVEAATDAELRVALPLLVHERLTGAVRATRPDAAVARRTHRAWLLLAALGLVLIAMATAVAVVLARRLSAPLERLAAGARRLGEGDFAARAPRTGVDEVDEVAGALDATAARLDDMVARERAFTADASHQLRTPLAALRIELEAMQLHGDETPELETALGQVDRLQGTVETLLAVARDAPRATAEADLTALVDELADRWREPLAAESRPLRTQAGTGPALARASPAVVGEILDVLLSNALRHGSGAVTVRVRRRDKTLAVDVSDEGPGPPGDPELAFARRSGGTEGHGIGLALARSLAHAEQGRLTAERATFTLLLPAAASSDRAEGVGFEPT